MSWDAASSVSEWSSASETDRMVFTMLGNTSRIDMTKLPAINTTPRIEELGPIRENEPLTFDSDARQARSPQRDGDETRHARAVEPSRHASPVRPEEAGRGSAAPDGPARSPLPGGYDRYAPWPSEGSRDRGGGTDSERPRQDAPQGARQESRHESSVDAGARADLPPMSPRPPQSPQPPPPAPSQPFQPPPCAPEPWNAPDAHHADPPLLRPPAPPAARAARAPAPPAPSAPPAPEEASHSQPPPTLRSPNPPHPPPHPPPPPEPSAPPPVAEAAVQPPPLSKEDEELSKRAVLLDLHNLQTQNGVRLTKEWTMDDRLEDMTLELRRHVLALDEKNNVGMMKNGLKLCLTAIEMFSTKFGVLDLDGWSSQACAELGKQDVNLARIYRKWWRRSSGSSPEVEIGMAIVSSMAYHHMKRSMTRQMVSHMRPSASRTARPESPVTSSDEEGPP